MKKYLLDTNIIIDALKGDEVSFDFIKLNIANIKISYITYFETIVGSRNKNEFILIKRLLDSLKIDYGSELIIKKAMEIVDEHFLKSGINMYDAIIASTSLINNDILVSNDKYMKKFEGINLISLRK